MHDVRVVFVGSDLQLTYGEALIKGSYLIINDVVALADVSSSTGKVSPPPILPARFTPKLIKLI